MSAIGTNVTLYQNRIGIAINLQKEIRILTNEIQNNPNSSDNARNTFDLARDYLLQSEKSFKYYKKRIEMKGFNEEVFMFIFRDVDISQLN